MLTWQDHPKAVNYNWKESMDNTTKFKSLNDKKILDVQKSRCSDTPD